MRRNKLINKQYKDYSKVSRYLSVPYYYNKDNNTYGQGTAYYLNLNTVYSRYQVVYGDTLDSLALKFYNNPTYYWVICSFNRIQDCNKELEVGQILNIPLLSTIEFNI